MNFPDIAHVRQLQTDLWAWPKSRSAVMVGAGFSLNAEPSPGVTKRFPTWRELVRSMFDELHPKHPDESPDEAHSRKRRFANAGALRIASEYEAAFGPNKLASHIRSQTPDSDFSPGSLHYKLLQLPWVDVFTTNYDTLLERTDVPGRNYHLVTKASELTTASAPRIVKLHGSFPSQTPFIICEEHYRIYPKEFAPFVNTVQQCLLENSLVLLGFSGDDPNFLEWTGWIRDELGESHCPIYLVGPLSLTNAEHSLLRRRGVTPIDLSPLFGSTKPRQQIHAASIAWFLESLQAGKPHRPERWPNFEHGRKLVKTEGLPPLLDAGPITAPAPELALALGTSLTQETTTKLLGRWRFERDNYPGWVVAAEERRSMLWEQTKYWIDPLVKFAANLDATNRLLLFREINWRLETAMVPLFGNWISAFEEALNDVHSRLQTDAHSLVTNKGADEVELRSAWLEIGFSLLREARETYNSERWKALKSKIDELLPTSPQYSDRNSYEAALWAIWNVERKQARNVLAEWQPSARMPLAAMWKAGLLAELDDVGESRTILRSTLAEIRRALRHHGRNSELLSLEGWCMFLLFQVEMSLDFSKHYDVFAEFSERWQELKAFDCSPWPHKEHLETILRGEMPKLPKREQKVYKFDLGELSTSHHYASDLIGPFLPGFACVRLFEQVGIPMRLPRINVLDKTLRHACEWIVPFIGFWSPALLVRAGNHQGLSEILTLTEVATMDKELVNRLHDWSLQIFEREITSVAAGVAYNSATESVIKSLPEVLSRLSLRVDMDRCRKGFAVALKFHTQPTVRTNFTFHDVCKPWFRRLFESADPSLLLEWIPDLIRVPLINEGVHPNLPIEHTWPDPMGWFPKGRLKQFVEKSGVPDAIAKALDSLLLRINAENGEAEHRALLRLIQAYESGLMSLPQQEQLARHIWRVVKPDGLPQLPHFRTFALLKLPAPSGVDVQTVVRKHILTLKPVVPIVKDESGKLSRATNSLEQPFILETIGASKLPVPLVGENDGRIQWTASESRQLYLTAREWWHKEREFLDRIKLREQRQFFAWNPLVEMIEALGPFLSLAVLPCMEWATDSIWTELLDWLREIRNFEVFPTVALPYVLLGRPSEQAAVTQIIASDIESDVEGAVAAAAQAVRHWVALYSSSLIPQPDSRLLTKITERVIFRRRTDIESCINQLSYIIFEHPAFMLEEQAALVSDSLLHWHFVTEIPERENDAAGYGEPERPLLRYFLSKLAGAMSRRHRRLHPNLVEHPVLRLWQSFSQTDPLPKLRRAFDVWDFVAN